MESPITDVLPNDWVDFKVRRTPVEDLANLKAGEIGLSKESQDLFSIWSIMVNNPKLKQNFQEILSSKHIDDSSKNAELSKFVQLIGIGENELKTVNATNKDYRTLGLLKTFNPANLVEDDFELKSLFANKGPREIFRLRFESGYNMFVDDANFRFPNKVDSPSFIKRIANIHAALCFLDLIN